MKTNLVLIGVVVGLLAVMGLVVAGLFLPRVEVQSSQPSSRALAGVDGSDLTGCTVTNGVQFCYYKQKFNMASTTACSLKLNATSTLYSAYVDVIKATTTNIMFDIAKATGNNAATTTKLGSSFIVGAGTTAGIMASSSSAGAVQDYIFQPTDYFNVKYGGPTASANASNGLIGYCTEVFISNF